MAETIKTTAGVQELVRRLRDEGVQAGKQEAEQLLKEARDTAAAILAEARADADKILQQASIKNEAEKVHAQESLKIAVRDTEIELQRGLEKAFMSHVTRLVSKEVRDEEFLRHLLLTIVGSAAETIPQDQAVEVLVPDQVFQSEALKNFVRRGTSEMLREGVDLKPSSDLSGGIQVKLAEDDVVFDFSENALADLILKHLLPRYRAIVAGVE
jgi:V/A-type H+-transporting ATPase subunit E